MDKKITPKALAFAQDIVDNRNESTNVIIDYIKPHGALYHDMLLYS